jgi:hypothetical protein
MRRLHGIQENIVVDKNRTSNGPNANSIISQFQLFKTLGNQLVNRAMVTSRAIMAGYVSQKRR